MKKVYDAVVTTGKYTDKQSGKEKNRYLTVGAVFVNDEGQYSLKLEAIPTVGFTGWINFYEPRERTEKPAANHEQGHAAPKSDEFNDDIPF